jgi:hypothetical protein
VNSSKASRDLDSTPPECSRHGSQEAHAEEKGCMTPDAVDYEMDVTLPMVALMLAFD